MRSDAHLRPFLALVSVPFTPQLPFAAVQTLCCTVAPAGSSAILQLLAAAAGPKAATTEAPEATAQHHHLSGAPMPIYSACLSSPPIQALKCLVKFTEAHHLLDWSLGRGPTSKFSLSHLIKSHKERVQRKQRDDLQCNSRARREKNVFVLATCAAAVKSTMAI